MVRGPDRRMQVYLRPMLLLILTSAYQLLVAQAPSPVQRVEGVDAETGTQYVRLSLLNGEVANPDAIPPRLTFECTKTYGKSDLRLYLTFGGVTDKGFLPPFHPTPGKPYQLIPTNMDLKMQFVGYRTWRPYVESWQLMRSGELRYRDSGWHSPNMEPVQFVLKTLNALPGLRLVHNKPVSGDPGEVFFQTAPLLDAMANTPLCSPSNKILNGRLAK
jgi:hypothetical protein